MMGLMVLRQPSMEIKIVERINKIGSIFYV